MPRFGEEGQVVFAADEPDYTPREGMQGKGNWIVIVVESREPEGDDDQLAKGLFGPFPSDEDATDFAEALIDPKRFLWTVDRMADPRDYPATGKALAELALIQVHLFRLLPRGKLGPEGA